MKVAAYSCVVGFAVAGPSHDVRDKFEAFRTKWGRTYGAKEYIKRIQFFEEHLHQVEQLQREELGTATYTYLGPFADFSSDEMSQRFGLIPQDGFEEIPVAPFLNKTLGSSFDWVSKGAVNPIKDQGQCGSCWSFSTACNLEGTGFVNTGKLVSLSEQELVDCDKSCHGCNGGLQSLALTWTKENGGLGSESSYPYTARDGRCHSVGSIAKNTGYNKISKDEDQIAQALTTYGPLAIAVDATPYQSYKNGVMKNPKCSKTRLDHAINIVGYGVDQIQYWKIRNSWGTVWGEKGYIRVSRGDCQCGLCTTVVTATGTTISDSPGPAPPGPSPTPDCADAIPDCPTGGWECDFLARVCQKSCGCCDASPPSYCSSSNALESAGIPWDEILKLICQEMEKGTTEPAAEKLICGKLNNNLEIAGCDKLVEFAWSSITKKDCPAVLSHTQPTIV